MHQPATAQLSTRPRPRRPGAPSAAPIADGVNVVVSDGAKVSQKVNAIRERIERRAFLISQERSGSGDPNADWLRAEKEIVRAPAIELIATAGGVFIRVELPGVHAEEIEIGLEQRKVRICADRNSPQRDGELIYSEICERDLLRNIVLPIDVRREGAQAQLKSGVLELFLPAAAASRPRGF